MELKMSKYSKYLLLILLIAFIIRLAPALMSQGLVGVDTYYHKSVAEQFLSGEFGFSDAFSFSKIMHGSYPMGFHSFMAAISSMGIPLEILFRFIPPFFALLVTFLFYKFAREFAPEKYALLATFLMTTTPIIVQRTSQAIPEDLGMLFFFTALIMLVKFAKTNKILYLIPFVLISVIYVFFHRGVFFLLILIPILLLTLYRDKLRLKIVLPLIALLALSSYFWLWPVLEMLKRLPWEPVSAKGFLLVSGIMLIPALPGIIMAYKRNEPKGQFLLVWLVLFCLAGTMSFRFRDPHMMYPLAILAAYGFYDYIQPTFRKWFNVKALLVILVIIAFLQSGFTVGYTLPKPTQAEYDVLSWIDENTPKDSIVLSWREEGYWVNGIAHRRDVILWALLYNSLYTDEPMSVDESVAVYKDAEVIFRSTNKTRAMELLDFYNVSYIYIDQKMAYEMEGLEFGLLEYINSSNNFKEVYRVDEMRVYEVIYGEN